MSWDVDMVFMTRALINDLSVAQAYTDEYLQRIIIIASIMVDAEFQFSYNYLYSISDLTITPDPVANMDYVFMSLIPLKAACIIIQGEFKQAIGQGIKVRDGDSSIDTSVSFRGYKDIISMGPCSAYDKLKWQLTAAGINCVGKAVLGPNSNNKGTYTTNISWYYDELAVMLINNRGA